MLSRTAAQINVMTSIMASPPALTSNAGMLSIMACSVWRFPNLFWIVVDFYFIFIYFFLFLLLLLFFFFFFFFFCHVFHQRI